MKKIFLSLFISIFIISCQPDDIPPIGEKTDYQSKLSGTWVLEKIVQIDAEAESKSFPEFATIKNLTNIFPNHPYTDFSITLNADGTFSSSNGKSYMQVLSEGNWEIDDLEYPSALILSNNSESQEVNIGSLADIILKKIEFKEERRQADTGKIKIRYIYTLTKK